jgi:adenosylmethionine-8-amino-7-oxononanoate aminotransferase
VIHTRYSNLHDIEESTVLAAADGIYLRDQSGRRYIDIDGVATHHNVNVGHSHKALVSAAKLQMGKLARGSYRPGLTHRPLFEIIQAILRQYRDSRAGVYYTLRGPRPRKPRSKMARAYWPINESDSKRQVVSLVRWGVSPRRSPPRRRRSFGLQAS